MHSNNNEDERSAGNEICVTYTQADSSAHRDDAESGNIAGPQAPLGSAMRRQIEALQMEMARLTSTVREVMLEVEMGGPRGPPPAYEEDADEHARR